MSWIVYCHTHIESGRRYIGLTKRTLRFRWNQHVLNAKKKLGKGCHHFWAAIRKYGKDAFSHNVLETCDTLEEANEAEEAWISSFSSRYPDFGFNLARGGNHVPDSKPLSTEERSLLSKQRLACSETRLKISQAAKDQASTPAGKQARSDAAKSMTAETRILAAQKAAIKLRGKSHSEKHRTRISAALSGRQLSEEHKSNLRGPRKVKKTHCKNGHSLEDAWVRKSNGARLCRTCNGRKVHWTSVQSVCLGKFYRSIW